MFIIESIPRLNINKLIKGSYIIPNAKTGGTYKDKEGDLLINIESDFTGDIKTIRVKYENLLNNEWIEYEIIAEGVLSNLGIRNAMNYYFLCPKSGERVKILYYDPVNQMYVAKKAHSQKLYYFQEIISKNERTELKEDRNNLKLLEKFYLQKKQSYQGKLTKMARNINERIQQRDLLDALITEKMIKEHGEF